MTTNQVAAADLTVETRGAAAEAAGSAVKLLAADDIAARLAAKDAGLWGPVAAEEAAVRLNWLDLPRTSTPLLAELTRLRADAHAAGIDRVVLAGMGGSSLAPEVIAADRGAELVTLDTTDPGQVRQTLAGGLERTALVVSSKSGGTIETDSHRRVFESAFRDAALEPADHIFVVTDPGSPLAELAAKHGYRTILADPNVGGRYSALSAFGLVPSALAGVDVAALLREAQDLAPALGTTEDNPALLLGAALGGSGERDKLILAGDAPVGLGDWIEQLVAESTGKDATGLLPVVVEDPAAPGTVPGPDTHPITFSTAAAPAAPDDGTAVAGPLGAQFLAWEYATAVAGRLLGIDPFNQPNVQESKDNTRQLLEGGDATTVAGPEPLLVDGPVAVHATEDLGPGSSGDLSTMLRTMLDSVPESGYLAVMAYLDRDADSAAASLRSGLAAATSRPVTFGWGPRFLHSTGQYHKGGPANGVFLQITGENADDLAVPGRPYTFGELQLAQALGDFGALGTRGRPVVRLHLRDRALGVDRVREAVASLRR